MKFTPKDYKEIVCFNELRSTEELLEFFKNDMPFLTKNPTWSKSKRDKYIDSVLHGLPTPKIILTLCHKLGKRSIVDGFERLKSLYLYTKNNLSDYDFNNRTHEVSVIMYNDTKEPRLVKEIRKRLNS